MSVSKRDGMTHDEKSPNHSFNIKFSFWWCLHWYQLW